MANARNTTEIDGLKLPLSDAQMEILKYFNTKMTKKELEELKDILLKFLNELAMRKIDKLEASGRYLTKKEIAKIHHK